MNPTAKPLESDIQTAIQDGFYYTHRILLHAMDAGDKKHRALNSLPVLFDPPGVVLEALSIPLTLPLCMSVALRLPPGFPDLVAPNFSKLHPGVWLFIEVKRPSRKPDSRQKHFLELARKSGHVAIWADSLNTALAKFEVEMEKLTPTKADTTGIVRVDAVVRPDWRNNLSSLPDFDKACLAYETLPTGETVVHRKILPRVLCEPMKGSDPVAFTDKDGAWFVVYGHEGGPHKRRA